MSHKAKDINNPKNTIPECMSDTYCMPDTYCPPFGIVLAHLFSILFSIGMIWDILQVLSQRSSGAIPPLTYFFFLAFVAVIVLSSFVLIHMLFPKHCLLPPPSL